VRLIEDCPVITGFTAADPNSLAQLKNGDVIIELDGFPLGFLFTANMPRLC